MDTIYHFGIKGMKWGVRRFQNKDGTLTAEGKKRYEDAKLLSDEELKSQVQRLNMEKQHRNLKKNAEGPSKLERTKKLVDSASTLVNESKKISKEAKKTAAKGIDLSEMTDQQLRDRINRFNLERQYNDIFGADSMTVSKGQKLVDDILDGVGTALTLGSSAIGLAIAIKELRK